MYIYIYMYMAVCIFKRLVPDLVPGKAGRHKGDVTLCRTEGAHKVRAHKVAQGTHKVAHKVH